MSERDADDDLQRADAMRRAVLGDEYVDRVTDVEGTAAEFQDYITSMAWGVWAR